MRLVIIPVLALLASGLLPASAVRSEISSELKVLGMIGGTSWHSTIECYRYINQSINDVYGNNTNPPLVLYNMNQYKIHELQGEGRWDDIAVLLSAAARKLHAAGAEAITLCANTPYKVYPAISRETRLPILHVADATGMAIRDAGLEKVGLIGTVYTMEDAFIKEWLEKHYGIDVLVPANAGVRQELHRIVQEELGMGIFEAETKRYVLRQIANLEDRGAKGIVLGCTEFPLIIGQEDLDIPVFDTTQLHSRLAVEFILGRYSPREPSR